VVSFSVIIVTHGREELLSKCLDSLRPGVDDWQLVLVANGKELSEKIPAISIKYSTLRDCFTTPVEYAQLVNKYIDECDTIILHDFQFMAPLDVLPYNLNNKKVIIFYDDTREFCDEEIRQNF
jgi:hypothetical protein